MRIDRALPIQRYSAAAKHSRSPQFNLLVDETIALLRDWMKNPGINQKIPPCLWFGYGKDGMATLLLLKMAGIDFTALHIQNGGDIASHELVFDEFNAYIGDYRRQDFKTERRMIEYIHDSLEWGRAYGMAGKNKAPINFFDWGGMAPIIYYSTISRFHFVYGNKASNILNLWGNRGAEGMERSFEIKNYGLLSQWDADRSDRIPMWRGLPIGKWKDIDVWAILVRENCPVSPIYSMHAIPQKKGRGAFPRTLAYCTPHIFSSQFYRWLAYYAPAQLKEMIDLFPEIQQMVKSGNTKNE